MQNNLPLVTVIIPSYNHAQYIVEAIDSVKRQVYKNWELIVIDDGSKDTTHQVLKNLDEDTRIKIILNKDNRGQSVRMNQAIKISRGEYISIFTSDDWYLPEKLEKQIKLFNNLSEDYGVVYSGGYRYFEDIDKTIEVDTNSAMKRGWILENLIREPFFIYPITPLIKKKCLVEFPFDETYIAEGEAIHFKIAMKYKYDFVSEPLVVMRHHTYNIGSDIDAMLAQNIRNREELFQNPNLPKELLKYRGEVLTKIYRMKGLEYIRVKKEYSKGRINLIKAIKLNALLLFDRRVVLGIALTFLPKSLLKKVNP